MVTKMKIREDRRSDIIAARDTWDSEYERSKAEQDRQVQEFEDAQDEVRLFIEDKVRSILGRKHKDLSVDITFGSWSTIRVGNSSGMHTDMPLTWSFEVSLDKDGNVRKETGSWSGLRATSLEDIQQLRDTLDALEILNNIDWRDILTDMQEQLPHWKDYVSVKVPDRRGRPDFEAELKSLDIENAVGKEVLIKGRPIKYEKRFTKDSYYIIHKITPKQASVTEFPMQVAEDYMNREPDRSLFDIVSSYGVDYRVDLNKFLNALPKTIEIIPGR